MDRVLPSEGRGCWFDPSRAHQLIPDNQRLAFCAPVPYGTNSVPFYPLSVRQLGRALAHSSVRNRSGRLTASGVAVEVWVRAVLFPPSAQPYYRRRTKSEKASSCLAASKVSLSADVDPTVPTATTRGAVRADVSISCNHPHRFTQRRTCSVIMHAPSTHATAVRVP